MTQSTPVGPVSGTEVPRYAGAATFARLPDVAAVSRFDRGVHELVEAGARPIMLGGDHTIALGGLRALARQHGPVALIHFDAHLDTWNTYFGADRTHGTVFRRAHEEGLLIPDAGAHVGIRGPLYSAQDLADDASFGFQIIRSDDVDRLGVAEVADRVRRRVGDNPIYLSIDIDVLDPAFAPGTGTPEIGGLSSRELLGL